MKVDLLRGIVSGVAVLELKGVGKVYQRGARTIVALADVSFALESGECAVLYGLNRSGKSTLLRLVAGADAPSSGSVLFGGVDLAALDRRRRAALLLREIAWLPVSPDLQPELCAIEQVALCGYVRLRSYARARRAARAALATAGIEHCAKAQPSELSDGELRLLAIAQGIVKRPRLLLADEPAAELDLGERDRVAALLRACASELGAAVLFSASHADQTLKSTSLLYLSNGRLMTPTPSPEGKVIAFPTHRESQGRANL